MRELEEMKAEGPAITNMHGLFGQAIVAQVTASVCADVCRRGHPQRFGDIHRNRVILPLLQSFLLPATSKRDSNANAESRIED